MSYALTSPCKDCPFRSDIRPYLTRERIDQIDNSLIRAEFPCHKTTEHDDDDNYVPTDNEQHCAGALILLEKLERPSQMMRIAERLGLYDRRKLDMKAPVFDTFKEMRAAQPTYRRQKRYG
jgi:hypothetical protein